MTYYLIQPLTFTFLINLLKEPPTNTRYEYELIRTDKPKD